MKAVNKWVSEWVSKWEGEWLWWKWDLIQAKSNQEELFQLVSHFFFYLPCSSLFLFPHENLNRFRVSSSVVHFDLRNFINSYLQCLPPPCCLPFPCSIHLFIYLNFSRISHLFAIPSYRYTLIYICVKKMVLFRQKRRGARIWFKFNAKLGIFCEENQNEK